MIRLYEIEGLFDINLAFNLRVVKMSEIPQRPLRATRTPKFHNSDVFNIHMKDEEIDNYAALANPYKKVVLFYCRTSSLSPLPQVAWPRY